MRSGLRVVMPCHDSHHACLTLLVTRPLKPGSSVASSPSAIMHTTHTIASRVRLASLDLTSNLRLIHPVWAILVWCAHRSAFSTALVMTAAQELGFDWIGACGHNTFTICATQALNGRDWASFAVLLVVGITIPFRFLDLITALELTSGDTAMIVVVGSV